MKSTSSTVSNTLWIHPKKCRAGQKLYTHGYIHKPSSSDEKLMTEICCTSVAYTHHVPTGHPSQHPAVPETPLDGASSLWKLFQSLPPKRPILKLSELLSSMTANIASSGSYIFFLVYLPPTKPVVLPDERFIDAQPAMTCSDSKCWKMGPIEPSKIGGDEWDSGHKNAFAPFAGSCVGWLASKCCYFPCTINRSCSA